MKKHKLNFSPFLYPSIHKILVIKPDRKGTLVRPECRWGALYIYVKRKFIISLIVVMHSEKI